jgi:hypothetical protein
MEIAFTELMNRIRDHGDIASLEAASGLQNVTGAFYEHQIFPPGRDQAAFRQFLALLGYEFEDGEEIVLTP